MRVVEDVREAGPASAGSILTVGIFDGLHLGHRRIIDTVVRRAKETGLDAALMTMRPHPRTVLEPGNAPRLLTPHPHKVRLLEQLGLDVLYVLPFDDATSALDREHVVRELFVERCGARELYVGHDFRFGHKAKGNYDYLRDVAADYGFHVTRVDPVVYDGERVSSTLVRRLVAEGDMERAHRYLERPYSIIGAVEPGRGIGRKLGYPTANVPFGDYAVPAPGIYAAKVRLAEHFYLAGVNVGYAPTIPHTQLTIEAYLLDFEGNLIGTEVEIAFHCRLRPEKRFETEQALSIAIGQDIEYIRDYFAQPG